MGLGRVGTRPDELGAREVSDMGGEGVEGEGAVGLATAKGRAGDGEGQGCV